MQDARLGIVRLPLPDGRVVPLQLIYTALDSRGHGWLLEQFKAVQKGRAGAYTALAALLEVMSAGEIVAADMIAAPMATYPLAICQRAAWSAWELAQYGPSGRSAEEGPANPQKRRPTLWKRIFEPRSALD